MTGRISARGLTLFRSAACRAVSKSRYGSRSTLLSRTRSAARNICGYFNGLSAPSVTDAMTTRACSPRSKSAGQTKLPTFSITSTDPGRGSSAASPRATIAASR